MKDLILLDHLTDGKVIIRISLIAAVFSLGGGIYSVYLRDGEQIRVKDSPQSIYKKIEEIDANV